MPLKKTIKKLFLVSVWVVISAGVLTLLVAANRKEQRHVCREVVITIFGTGEKYFIGKSDIAGMLEYGQKGRLEKKPLTEINPSRLEALLEKSAWIAGAELYFDSRDVLHVLVTERQPVARVFTRSGNSFYIDTSGMRMPLLQTVSARVPVVTSFPDGKKLSKYDSLLVNDLKALLQFVANDKFWNAQVAQIDIKPNRTFDLVPTIGNHAIRLGTVDDMATKFNRLFLFYKQVLSKTGLEKYGVLDVRFSGQIVAVHNGPNKAVDSLQLKRNIDDLLKASRLLQIKDSLELEAKNLKSRIKEPEIKTPVPTTPKSNPLKIGNSSATMEKKNEIRVPKAVMKKRNGRP